MTEKNTTGAVVDLGLGVGVGIQDKEEMEKEDNVEEKEEEEEDEAVLSLSEFSLLDWSEHSPDLSATATATATATAREKEREEFDEARTIFELSMCENDLNIELDMDAVSGVEKRSRSRSWSRRDLWHRVMERGRDRNRDAVKNLEIERMKKREEEILLKRKEAERERDRILTQMTEERTRLEYDVFCVEEERSNLFSDAIVVTLELIISANYRPFCFWERITGFKVLNEGHEGIVGLISSFYVLNNIWPVVQKTCT